LFNFSRSPKNVFDLHNLERFGSAFSGAFPFRSFLIAFPRCFVNAFSGLLLVLVVGWLRGVRSGRCGSGRGVFCGVKVGRLVGGGVWGRGRFLGNKKSGFFRAACWGF